MMNISQNLQNAASRTFGQGFVASAPAFAQDSKTSFYLEAHAPYSDAFKQYDSIGPGASETAYGGPTSTLARTRRHKVLVAAAFIGASLNVLALLGVFIGTGHMTYQSSSSGGALTSTGASSRATPSAFLPIPNGMPTNAEIEAADPLAWPNLQMISNPGGAFPKAVALSFDDGPGAADSAAHNHVLDQLRKYNLQATFFVNGNASTDVLNQPAAQAALRRTLAEGHSVGSHTYTHALLTGLSPTEVVAQFEDNLQVLRDSRVFGPSFTPTLTRVPFGAPIQANSSDVLWMAPLMAPYGVHVGWGIDTKDYACAGDGKGVSCIIERFAKLLDDGRSGVILMHSVYQLTGDALPAMLEELSKRNYSIVSVENMVAAKYAGANSRAVMEQWAARRFTPHEVAASAFNASRLNNDKGTAK